MALNNRSLPVLLSSLSALLLLQTASAQSFGPQEVLSTSADSARSVYATDLDGDGDADVLSASANDDKIAWYENSPPVNVVCVGDANSTGAGASLTASGSFEVVNNDTTLELTGLPLNQSVLFVNSRETILLANPGGSQGDLCIGSLALGRHVNDIRDSGATGTASLTLDLANVPTNLGRTAVLAGETWYWQAWYRDVDGGGTPTSNFSSAISVTFD